MEQFTEELRREYFNALYNQQNGYNDLMLCFKKEHGELWYMINTMYHKRKVLRENMKAMQDICLEPLVFGALTYDEEHDKQNIETKRKQATRHLSKYFDAYLFVEELGHDNERYHIHFIGTLKKDIQYLDFCNAWHSRAQIEKVISRKNTINYLTDYVVKQVPRIRRNKKLITIFNHWKKAQYWRNYGFEGFAEEEEFSALLEYSIGV